MPERDSRRLRTQPTLTDGVVTAVRSMVRSGELKPSELYSVYQLADMLHVSRSPVREGLLKLAASGAVNFERNRGFRVLVPEPHDIAEIFAVRVTLESAAVSLLARRSSNEDVDAIQEAWLELRHAVDLGDEDAFWTADLAFHDALLRRSGNKRAAEIVRDLRELTRLIGVGTTASSRSLREIADEHQPIVAAVVAGDSILAGRAMTAHLTETGLTLLAQSMGLTADAPEVEALWRDALPD
jgi:DNA-binding GntR family transcriptional regulator